MTIRSVRARFASALLPTLPLTLVCAVLLAGCSDMTGLHGHWAGTQTVGHTQRTFLFVFKPGGSYTEDIDTKMTDNSSPPTTIIYSGTYEYDQSLLTITPRNMIENMETSPVFGAGSDSMSYKHDGNSLKVVTSDGPLYLQRRFW